MKRLVRQRLVQQRLVQQRLVPPQPEDKKQRGESRYVEGRRPAADLRQLPAARGRAVCVWLAALAFFPATLQAQQPAAPFTALQAALTMEKVVVDAIARAEKSVVAIACVRQPARLEPVPPANLPVPDWILPENPRSPDFIPNEFGAGVVVDERGLIVTNAHVLGKWQQTSYYVWLAGQSYPANVKAVDPWMDLAVLQIEAKNLQPIQFGKVSDLRRGQFVIALGNPYAIARDGQPSASWGIIANLSRQAAPGKTATGAPQRESRHHFGTLIQTDAKLNLGASGGALLNLRGEMVGLTTSLAAVYGYEKSAGFAVPVDESFQRALDTLKMGRVPEYGFLGVEPENLTEREQTEGRFGARVGDVIHGTPAFQAGVQRNDIITHVDGLAIRNATHLILRLSSYPAEAKVQLTTVRAGGTATPVKRHVVLSKKFVNSARPAFSEIQPPLWRGMRVDYATAIPSSQFYQRAGEIDLEGCVAIIDVAPESPAWKAGLRPFSFISHVEETRVKTPRQFHAAVEGRPGDVKLQLTQAVAQDRAVVVAAEASR